MSIDRTVFRIEDFLVDPPGESFLFSAVILSYEQFSAFCVDHYHTVRFVLGLALPLRKDRCADGALAVCIHLCTKRHEDPTRTRQKTTIAHTICPDFQNRARNVEAVEKHKQVKSQVKVRGSKSQSSIPTHRGPGRPSASCIQLATRPGRARRSHPNLHPGRA